MSILVFVTLFNMMRLSAPDSVLSDGKQAYYNLDKVNLTTFLTAENFAGLSFESFMLIDLGSMHYVVNVTMKLHYKNLMSLKAVTVKNTSPSEEGTACVSEENLDLSTFTGVCMRAARFVEITSRKASKIISLVIYGDILFSEIFAGCYDYISTGPAPRKTGNFLNSFKLCQNFSIPYLIIRNDRSYKCLDDLTELLPTSALNCQYVCSPQLACGISKYYALYRIAHITTIGNEEIKCVLNKRFCKPCKEGLTGITCSLRDCKIENGACGDFKCEVLVTDIYSYSYCTCYKDDDATFCHSETLNCSTNDKCDKDSSRCLEVKGSSSCACLSGFKKYLMYRCQDVDECEEQIGCRGSGFVCTNSIGSFKCSCNFGFVKMDEITCRDRDECYDGPHHCDLRTTDCMNSPGSYFCRCLDGYRADDVYKCKDINECAAKTHTCNTTYSDCVNTAGSFSCDCTKGGKGLKSNCQDIDECDKGGPCDVKTTKCVNNYGSFSCDCQKGYKKHNIYVCKDADECSTKEHTCEGHSTCTNTVGSYKCSCRSGLSLKNYTTHFNCEDVDECLKRGACDGRSSICVNFYEGYTCHCRVGYASVNKYTCKKATTTTADDSSSVTGSADYDDDMYFPAQILETIRSNVMYVYFGAGAFPFVSLLAYFAFRSETVEFTVQEVIQLGEEMVTPQSSMPEIESE